MDPTRDQVAEALQTISTLYRIGYGVVTNDDRFPKANRKLLAFYGISPASVAVIRAGMTEVTEINITPLTAGNGNVQVSDIYGMVAAMLVRVSTSLPDEKPPPTEQVAEAAATGRLSFRIPRLGSLAARLREPAEAPYDAQHRAGVSV